MEPLKLARTVVVRITDTGRDLGRPVPKRTLRFNRKSKSATLNVALFRVWPHRSTPVLVVSRDAPGSSRIGTFRKICDVS
jgi:hypothetical protein